MQPAVAGAALCLGLLAGCGGASQQRPLQREPVAMPPASGAAVMPAAPVAREPAGSALPPLGEPAAGASDLVQNEPRAAAASPCRLPPATISLQELLAGSGRFTNARVIIDAYVAAERGACTAQVCEPSRPCCNCGYSPALVASPAELASAERLPLVWVPSPDSPGLPAPGFGCRRDPASCSVACEPPIREPIRVQGRFRREEDYSYLEVDAYCVGAIVRAAIPGALEFVCANSHGQRPDSR
jgi:hypothetical protein